MSLDITAHHFNVDSSPPSSILLLEAARKLVDAASPSKWRFIRPPIARLSPTGTYAGACFEWGREPPLIDRNTEHTESELRDWDAPFDDDMEVIYINSLPEFEEMDFGDVFVQPGSRSMKCIPGSAPSTHGRRGEVDVNSNTQPRKCLRSQSKTPSTPPETISISKLIPFPHYYESPDPARPPPRGIDSIPAFHVARSLSPSVSLTAPFARTAWLVPLRGVPHLMWTPAAVTQFLLRQRSMNNFGPISLGYMFSSPSVQKNSSWAGRHATVQVAQIPPYFSGIYKTDCIRIYLVSAHLSPSGWTTLDSLQPPFHYKAKPPRDIKAMGSANGQIGLMLEAKDELCNPGVPSLEALTLPKDEDKALDTGILYVDGEAELALDTSTPNYVTTI
ncbi:hypothetical protein JB92DRAFT_3144463 [Gautieria morchelliformis]|nr:hypothetical protein JB92DRAFT_3144463 [Gautieria morchelliformis]